MVISKLVGGGGGAGIRREADAGEGLGKKGFARGEQHPLRNAFGDKGDFKAQGKLSLSLEGFQPGKMRILELDSPEAKPLIQASLDYLKGLSGPYGDFLPQSVMQDDLGIAHVRFDREFEGLPVYGDQVICHVRQGKVEPSGDLLPIELSPDPVVISSEDALKMAEMALMWEVGPEGMQGIAENPPKSDAVIYRNQEGVYRRAYHLDFPVPGAELMIDSQSGELAQPWGS